MTLELKAEPREIKGKKVKYLRKTGYIPGIIYGYEMSKAQPIKIKYSDFANIYKKAGESTILELMLGKDKKNVLIHDVDYHPVTDKFIHVDFYLVRMDKKITIQVPLKFVNEAPAVKSEGGVLVKNIHEITVEALPRDLTHEMEVDISALKTFEDSIRIKDLDIPSGIEILDNEEDVVATVIPPRTEKELEELEGEVEEKVEEVEGIAEEEKEGESKEKEGEEKEEKSADQEKEESQENK